MNPPPNIKPIWSPQQLATAVRQSLGSRATAPQLELLRALLRFDDWSYDVRRHRVRPIDVATTLHTALRRCHISTEIRRQFRRILHRCTVTLRVEIGVTLDAITFNLEIN